MTQTALHREPALTKANDRDLSQWAFVMVSLLIIICGLLYLYMGDAPYHPEAKWFFTGSSFKID
ncbi:MAG: hypothetical protein AAF307_12460 [Pseudomonadota bacterium]